MKWNDWPLQLYFLGLGNLCAWHKNQPVNNIMKIVYYHYVMRYLNATLILNMYILTFILYNYITLHLSELSTNL